MWCDHPFNQRNKTTEKVVGVGFGGDREGGGGQNLKREGVGNIIRELGPLWQLCHFSAIMS